MTSRLSSLATSNQLQSNTNPSVTESIKEPLIHDLIPLPVTPVSPSSSISDESSSINDNLEIPSIFQTIIPSSMTNEQTNEIPILPSNANKRSYDHQLADEGLVSSKRSRSSEDNFDQINSRLTFKEIAINDKLLIKCNLKHRKEFSGQCLEKNNEKKELFIHYQGLDSK